MTELARSHCGHTDHQQAELIYRTYGTITSLLLLLLPPLTAACWRVCPVEIFYNHPLTCSPGEQEQTQQQYHHFRYGQFFCLNNERITTT